MSCPVRYGDTHSACGVVLECVMFNFGALGLRARLKRGVPIGAFWMTTGSTAVMEIAARHEPDAIVVDAQHGLFDRTGLEHAVGLVSNRVPVLVRTAENSAVAIGQALDTGAEGVIVPLIETDSEAAAAVAAARFPPHGTRSGGGVRPLTVDFAHYYAAANDRTVVGVMIETQRGVHNAAAIANTKGIDFVLIGTGDLAISLGGFPNVDERHEKACKSVFEACKAAGVPCGIFTMNAEAAAKRRREGYAFVTVADDIDIVSRGFAAAKAKFERRQQGHDGPECPGSKPRHVERASRRSLRLPSPSGGIRVVDLTQTLKPSTPVIQLPPPFAPSDPFRISEISRYDERGPAWYWNNISLGEHTGTHFDAPCHWVTGKDNAHGYTDTVPVQRFVAPAVRDRLQQGSGGGREIPARARAYRGVGGQARPHSRRRLGADAYRLVQARRPRAIPQHEGRRAAYAGTVRGRGQVPDRSSATSTAGASRRSAPTTARPSRSSRRSRRTT